MTQEIEVWEEFIQHQKKLLDEAIKYGDYGGRVSAEEMIRYAQDKIETLEMKLGTYSKGA